MAYLPPHLGALLQCQLHSQRQAQLNALLQGHPMRGFAQQQILANQQAANAALGMGAVPSGSGLGFVPAPPPRIEEVKFSKENIPYESKFGEIIAWKMLGVTSNPAGDAFLCSPYQKETIWRPGAVMKASGKPSELAAHGFYAWKTRADSTRETQGTVLAKMMLWGDVVEHEYGYRAEYARILDVEDEGLQKTYRYRRVIEHDDA